MESISMSKAKRHFYNSGARVLVKCDDSVKYPGTIISYIQGTYLYFRVKLDIGKTIAAQSKDMEDEPSKLGDVLG
jgi:hypothetical protein